MKTVVGHGLMKNLELELSERFWRSAYRYVVIHGGPRNGTLKLQALDDGEWKDMGPPLITPVRSSLDHDPFMESAQRMAILGATQPSSAGLVNLDEPSSGAQPCWRCYTYGREPAPKDAPAHTCVTVAR